jgi:hypothetical protein
MSHLAILICTHHWAGLLEQSVAFLNAVRRPALTGRLTCWSHQRLSRHPPALLDGYRKQAAERGWLPPDWVRRARALNQRPASSRRRSGGLCGYDRRMGAGYPEAVCVAAKVRPQAGPL